MSAAERGREVWKNPHPRRRPPARRPDVLGATEAARLASVSYWQLNRWCEFGLFGDERRGVGSGTRRTFTPAEVPVLAALGRISRALTFGERSSSVTAGLLATVADQVRSGADVVRVRLGDHVELAVDVADLRDPP
jgi:hypothetical protein